MACMGYLILVYYNNCHACLFNNILFYDAIRFYVLLFNIFQCLTAPAAQSLACSPVTHYCTVINPYETIIGTLGLRHSYKQNLSDNQRSIEILELIDRRKACKSRDIHKLNSFNGKFAVYALCERKLAKH